MLNKLVCSFGNFTLKLKICEFSVTQSQQISSQNHLTLISTILCVGMNSIKSFESTNKGRQKVGSKSNKINCLCKA